MAEVATVADCHFLNGPPLSELKTSNVRTPAPPVSSEPVHLTVKLLFSLGVNGTRLLVGATTSTTFEVVGVRIGAFVSKTIEAWFLIVVPDAIPWTGLTWYVM